MNLTIIDNTETLCALEKEWRILSDVSTDRNIFLTWDWQYEWWCAYGESRDLYVVAIYHDEQLVAILPTYIDEVLIVPGVPRARILRFMGTGEVYSDFLDIIVNPLYTDDVLQYLNHFFRTPQPWDFIEFASMLEEAVIGRIKADMKPAEVMWAAEGGVCPYVDFNQKWDVFLSSLSKKMRYEVRSDRKKLDAIGNINRYVVSDPDTLDHAMSEFKRLHQDRFISKGENGVFASPIYHRFHNAVARRLLNKGLLNLVFLQVDGVNVACRYQFIYKSRLFDYLPGMDTAWYKHSVGMVQLSYCVEDSINIGVERYEFLRGGESYKYRWKSQDQVLYTLRFARDSARSKFLFMLFRLKSESKRMLKALLSEKVISYIKLKARIRA
jgi:CelD/BcsL family acetyltransferase involved in cellulose biosynthesis